MRVLFRCQDSTRVNTEPVSIATMGARECINGMIHGLIEVDCGAKERFLVALLLGMTTEERYVRRSALWAGTCAIMLPCCWLAWGMD
jgi:hypothetical protein